MLMTALVLTAPFVIYALCYWLQSIRERNSIDPIVLRENHVGKKGVLNVVASGDTAEPSKATLRNRRKRKRKKK